MRPTKAQIVGFLSVAKSLITSGLQFDIFDAMTSHQNSVEAHSSAFMNKISKESVSDEIADSTEDSRTIMAPTLSSCQIKKRQRFQLCWQFPVMAADDDGPPHSNITIEESKVRIFKFKLSKNIDIFISFSAMVQSAFRTVHPFRSQLHSAQGFRNDLQNSSRNAGNPLLFATDGAQSTRSLCRITCDAHFLQVIQKIKYSRTSRKKKIFLSKRKV